METRWRRDGDAMETRTAYSAGGCTLTLRAVVHGKALVSLIYVLRCSAHTIYNERSRLHTVLNYSGPWRADLESVLEPEVAHDRHHRPHTRRACGPRGANPARRGQGRKPPEPRQGSAVLTDLLTTALDNHGRRGTEEPREQGRCDRLNSCGRL